MNWLKQYKIRENKNKKETAQEVQVQEQSNEKEKALNYLTTSFSELNHNSQLTKNGNCQTD